MEGRSASDQPQEVPHIHEVLFGRILTAEEVDKADYNFFVSDLDQAMESIKGLSGNGYDARDIELFGEKIIIINGPGTFMILRRYPTE